MTRPIVGVCQVGGSGNVATAEVVVDLGAHTETGKIERLSTEVTVDRGAQSSPVSRFSWELSWWGPRRLMAYLYVRPWRVGYSIAVHLCGVPGALEQARAYLDRHKATEEERRGALAQLRLLLLDSRGAPARIAAEFPMLPDGWRWVIRSPSLVDLERRTADGDWRWNGSVFASMSCPGEWAWGFDEPGDPLCGRDFLAAQRLARRHGLSHEPPGPGDYCPALDAALPSWVVDATGEVWA